MTDKDKTNIKTLQEFLKTLANCIDYVEAFILSTDEGICDNCVALGLLATQNLKINFTSLRSSLECLCKNMLEKGSTHDLH